MADSRATTGDTVDEQQECFGALNAGTDDGKVCVYNSTKTDLIINTAGSML